VNWPSWQFATIAPHQGVKWAVAKCRGQHAPKANQEKENFNLKRTEEVDNHRRGAEGCPQHALLSADVHSQKSTNSGYNDLYALTLQHP